MQAADFIVSLNSNDTTNQATNLRITWNSLHTLCILWYRHWCSFVSPYLKSASLLKANSRLYCNRFCFNVLFCSLDLKIYLQKCWQSTHFFVNFTAYFVPLWNDTRPKLFSSKFLRNVKRKSMPSQVEFISNLGALQATQSNLFFCIFFLTILYICPLKGNAKKPKYTPVCFNFSSFIISFPI